jgi:hypothetical protein
MSLQAEFDEFCRGYWADPDPKQCRCRGSGYALSDLDTWHQCPYHWTKQTRHPEEDWGDEPNPDQSLEVVSHNPQEKPKVPEDITEEDMIAAEFKPASPPPAEPLNEDEIPF